MNFPPTSTNLSCGPLSMPSTIFPFVTNALSSPARNSRPYNNTGSDFAWAASLRACLASSFARSRAGITAGDCLKSQTLLNHTECTTNLVVRNRLPEQPLVAITRSIICLILVLQIGSGGVLPRRRNSTNNVVYRTQDGLHTGQEPGLKLFILTEVNGLADIFYFEQGERIGKTRQLGLKTV